MPERAVKFIESQKKPIAPYVNQADGARMMIPNGYIQTFYNDPKMGRMPDRFRLIDEFSKLNYEEGKVGIEILDFLLRFKFASFEQIKEMVMRKGMDTELVVPLIEQFVKCRILNFFALAKSRLEEIPKDAFLLYCLDFGATSIISRYSDYYREVWFSSDAIYGSDMIARHLMVVIFYLQTLATGSKQIVYFKPWKDVRVGRKEIPFAAEFWAMKKGEKSVYLLDIENSRDLQEIWPEKLERLAMFLEEDNRWQQYYSAPPKFVFLTYNDKDAVRLGESMYSRAEYNGFRILTTANMVKGLNEPIFYTYMPASEQNQAGGFKARKLNIFAPEGK